MQGRAAVFVEFLPACSPYELVSHCTILHTASYN